MPEGEIFRGFGGSQGRTRIVELGGGRWGFQDPDEKAIYERADGTLFTRPSNRFQPTAWAVDRVTYAPDVGELVDSIGHQVPIAALRLPERGSVTQYKTVEARWIPLRADPSTFTPGANQELIERIVFRDAQGNLQTLDMSYGRAGKYDPSQTGAKWRYFAGKMAGEETDPGEGKRTNTRDLKRAVVYQEFLVKSIVPRAPTVTGR